MQERDVHEYTVSYSERAEEGVAYLKSLSHAESEVFFRAAREDRHGAPFEDSRHNRSYILSYEDRRNYHLERA